MADVTVALSQTHANMLRHVLRAPKVKVVAIRYYADGVLIDVVRQLEKQLPPQGQEES